MKTLFICCFLLSALAAFSQKPVDTSYTVYATYQKEIKKYPFITIATRPAHEQVEVRSEIPYKKVASGNLSMDAFLFRKGKNLPAVLLIHGGGWKSGSKEQMHLLAQGIAAKGYNCFCVGYRLSPEAQYPAGVLDVEDAIAFVAGNAEKFNTDAKRLAVLGCSSGGQMAALIGSTNTGRVKAVIDMDGILAFHHPESAEGKVAAEWLGGTYAEKPDVWDEASALTHTGKDTPPILFVNSDKPRFHAGRDDMTAILDRYGIYHEVRTIPDAPHSFWFFDPWLDEITTYSVAFLDRIFKR